MEAWLGASDWAFGPVFRKISRRGTVETIALHATVLPKILARRPALAGTKPTDLERLLPHSPRAGFITEAYKARAGDKGVVKHSRHRKIRTMRGYVRRAKLVAESPVGIVGPYTFILRDVGEQGSLDSAKRLKQCHWLGAGPDPEPTMEGAV